MCGQLRHSRSTMALTVKCWLRKNGKYKYFINPIVRVSWRVKRNDMLLFSNFNHKILSYVCSKYHE